MLQLLYYMVRMYHSNPPLLAAITTAAAVGKISSSLYNDFSKEEMSQEQQNRKRMVETECAQEEDDNYNTESASFPGELLCRIIRTSSQTNRERYDRLFIWRGKSLTKSDTWRARTYYIPYMRTQGEQNVWRMLRIIIDLLTFHV